MTAPVAPFTVARPERAGPVVFDSPHSGRHYPADFVTAASPLELRWAEDAYVDELLSHAPSLGIALLTAAYPRSYIDLNRPPDDIDEALLDGPWPAPLNPTEKSRRGLGLIRRFVVPGVVIYDAPLSVAEVQRRIDTIYAPYQRALDALLREAREAHGGVWHVNWHSMKSRGNAMTPDGAGALRADFVVSDRNGGTTSPALTSLIVDSLQAMGYTVSVNYPYLGGSIVQRVGRPALGVHSVQVEISRGLYLDEPEVKLRAGAELLGRNLRSLSVQLVAGAMAAFGAKAAPNADRERGA